MKKTFKIIGIICVVVSAYVGLVWFEGLSQVSAHVSKVLLIDPTSIDFGTVFPGEELGDDFLISLKDSDNGKPKVYSVQYKIKEKNGYGKSLCPYLDEERDPDEDDYKNDTKKKGFLKYMKDMSDLWLVDLYVPAVKGYVAQDHKGKKVKRPGEYECKYVIEVTDYVPFCEEPKPKPQKCNVSMKWKECKDWQKYDDWYHGKWPAEASGSQGQTAGGGSQWTLGQPGDFPQFPDFPGFPKFPPFPCFPPFPDFPEWPGFED